MKNKKKILATILLICFLITNIVIMSLPQTNLVKEYYMLLMYLIACGSIGWFWGTYMAKH